MNPDYESSEKSANDDENDQLLNQPFVLDCHKSDEESVHTSDVDFIDDRPIPSPPSPPSSSSYASSDDTRLPSASSSAIIKPQKVHTIYFSQPLSDYMLMFSVFSPFHFKRRRFSFGSSSSEPEPKKQLQQQQQQQCIQNAVMKFQCFLSQHTH